MIVVREVLTSQKAERERERELSAIVQLGKETRVSGPWVCVSDRVSVSFLGL